MLLADRRILVTGVLTDASIAFHVARLCQEQGAEVVLTGFGRGLRITQRTAKRLPQPAEVLELDVTDPAHAASVVGDLTERWGRLDGLVHAIAFAPAAAIDGDFLATDWDDVATAFQVSTWSLASLCRAFAPLMAESDAASVVGLDFDASVAWPGYDWMGVAKAGLESATRYCARDLGPQGTRVNLVAAGPLATVAAKNIPAFKEFEAAWASRAPLGWDVSDAEPVARTVCALLSPWMPGVTGSIVHCDGGAHAIGAASAPAEGATT